VTLPQLEEAEQRWGLVTHHKVRGNRQRSLCS
jgi:hypothetical protein